MYLPFHKEIANYNIYGEFDMYARDKFIGCILPNGELFECKKGQHGFGMSRNELDFFFNRMLANWSQEEALDFLYKQRDYYKNKMRSDDRLYMIFFVDWQINYAKNFFDLDSEFMKKYVGLANIRLDNGDIASFNCADFVVQLAHLDKVEKLPLTITTSRVEIYEHFFNYLLMDFNVRQIPAVVFNEEKGDFCYYRPDELITLGTERELEEEIKLIKKYIPLSERHNYFR